MKIHTTGETTSWTHGISTHRTASVPHGTGADITIHGTTQEHGDVLIGDILHGTTTRGITADGMTLGTTEDGMIHGTTAMPDSGTLGITCIRTMPDGTEDGTTHIGDITIITTDRDMARVTSLTTTTDRASTQAPDTAQVPTGCLHEAVRSEVAVQ